MYDFDNGVLKSFYQLFVVVIASIVSNDVDFGSIRVCCYQLVIEPFGTLGIDSSFVVGM